MSGSYIVISGHIGYTALKHTNFHISNPLPQQQKKQKELPTSTPDPTENHLRHGFPSRAAIAGRRLRVPRGRNHQPGHAHAALGSGAQVLLGLGTAKHMEKMWKKIWFEDIGIWHLEYFLAKDFKVVHVWKGTLVAFCFYEYKMSWSSAQFVGNRILIISFQTLTIGLMMQLRGRKQLLSLDFGRVFKCNSFKLFFLFRRQIN